ncbi:hypothetical protein [Flavobacterium sp. XGLA_31]|uniref:hypothetical protein n=1 Tax=Flavobacterium sp. XGLA_31 TaxID=3447666 RepID=UPI003F2A68C8
MEPNNIEKQFRDKLNVREIQPSSQAWDRLDAMLSVAEEKKTKRPFGFLFIAASILVLVTLGMFFFMPNSTEIKPINNVVGTETKADTLQNVVKHNQLPIVKSEKDIEAIATTDNQTSNQSSIINQKTTVNQKDNAYQSQIIKDKEIIFQNSDDVALKDLPKIVDSKETIAVKRETMSDADLLASLDAAAKQSTSKNSTMKVDAKSLLSQIDGELNQTFREKTFSKLSKNYQEIKVALANRNNKE